MTHARASTTLDLPEPFGPTTAQMPGSNFRFVADAKDLKPLSVSDLRCIRTSLALDEAGLAARLSPLLHDGIDHARAAGRGRFFAQQLQ